MKKTYRHFALVLAVFALAFCLVGCDALDEMRAVHGVYAGEKDYSSVTLNGVVYKNLNITMMEESFYRNGYSIVYLTEPGVPVLLSSTVGDHTSADEEMRFLFNYRDIDAVFVREDLYAQALAELKMEDPYTCMRLRYHNADYTEWKYYTLSEAEEAVIRGLLAQEPVVENGETYIFDSKSLIVVENGEHYISDSQSLIFESESGLYRDESIGIVSFSGGIALRSYNYTEKGETLLYPATGEAAQLLWELLEKYPG